MEENYEMKINALPSKTWHWLHLNDTTIQWKPAPAPCQVLTEGGKPFEVSEEEKQAVETGAGKEADVLFTDPDVSGYGIQADETNKGETVRMTIGSREAEGSAGMLFVKAEKESELTLIQTFPEGNLPADRLAFRTQIRAKAGSKIRLVQIFMQGEQTELLNDIGCTCEEGAKFELLQMVIGRGNLYNGIRTDLNGAASDVQIAIGYLGQKQQTVDLNLVVDHWGQKTTSEINAAGALKDDARKIFRGTIDFKRGSAGSVGNEQETVLMLGDGAVNKTVPLILCAEENVVGNHGATIGELDEDTLFYFESRGISAAEAENIMACAAIERLARTLQDETAQAAILTELEEVL